MPALAASYNVSLTYTYVVALPKGANPFTYTFVAAPARVQLLSAPYAFKTYVPTLKGMLMAMAFKLYSATAGSLAPTYKFIIRTILSSLLSLKFTLAGQAAAIGTVLWQYFIQAACSGICGGGISGANLVSPTVNTFIVYVLPNLPPMIILAALAAFGAGFGGQKGALAMGILALLLIGFLGFWSWLYIIPAIILILALVLFMRED